MSVASRFRTLPDTGDCVQFYLDDLPVMAPAGVTLAAALLAHSRQTAQGAPRTAFCMMGICFDCLVNVNGTPNTQACMTPVREGMVVRRQLGLRSLNGDQDD